MIYLRDLYVIYQSTPTNIVANKGISLKVSENGIFAITGPNGSGKSTLLKVLSGELNPSAGELFIRDELIHKSQLSQELSALVASLPQEFEFKNDISAKQLIARNHNTDLAEDLIRTLDLETIWSLPINSLEHNQRQLIALALTLSSIKPVILLDEPTKYLDQLARARLLKVLTKLAKTRSIVIATHDLGWSKEIKNVVHIQNGRIVQHTQDSKRATSTDAGWKFVGRIEKPERLASFRSHRNIKKCHNFEDFLACLAKIPSPVHYFEPSQSTLDELTAHEIFTISKIELPTELTPHSHQRLKALSGGERSWVYLNFHIAKAPSHLFLLYPSLNLDSGNQRRLREQILKLAKSGTKITLFDLN